MLHYLSAVKFFKCISNVVCFSGMNLLVHFHVYLASAALLGYQFTAKRTPLVELFVR